MPLLNPGDQYPVITRSVLSIDGHTRLELSYYDQNATTIDLVGGNFTSQLQPPRFKDDSQVSTLIQTMTPKTDILLLDPSYPERVPYLKMVGNEERNLTELLNITISDNTQTGYTEFLFDKINKNIEDVFKLIVCYNYGDFDNLQEFCDEDTHHAVINALGFCFLDF